MELRPVSWRDALFLYRLATDPLVRQPSLDASPPTILGHTRWMRRWMSLSDRVAKVLIIDGQRVGLVRAERLADGGAEIGIALVGHARGGGRGTAAIAFATPELAESLGVTEMFARIRHENAASS